MDPDHLVLAIMTVDRTPEHIHQTLDGPLASDPWVHELLPIHLAIGTIRQAHVASHDHHRLPSFHPLFGQDYESRSRWSTRRRSCHNYVLCLDIETPDGGGICIGEDDVISRDLFPSRLLPAIDEMEREASLRDCFLALLSAWGVGREPPFFRDRFFCSYDHPLYGTQCMYCTEDVARAVRDRLQENGVDQTTQPGDTLIRKPYGDRAYASPRSLADHVGAASTCPGGRKGASASARRHVASTREVCGKARETATWYGPIPLPH